MQYRQPGFSPARPSICASPFDKYCRPNISSTLCDSISSDACPGLGIRKGEGVGKERASFRLRDLNPRKRKHRREEADNQKSSGAG